MALKVGLGDDVYVYAPGTDGYGAAAYTVQGLLDFSDPNREIGAAYLSLAAAQELAAPDGLSRLELHYSKINTVAEDSLIAPDLNALRRALGAGTKVEAWRQLDPGLAGMLNFIAPMMVVVSLIFFVLAGLLVLNTVYLSTLERVREFGVILSLGAKGRQVMGMVTLERLIMCLTGAALGLALGATTTYGDLDLSFGIERLPLETARLSVPYSVETVGVRGVRHGVPGVRGVLYSGNWRVQGAVFYSDTERDFLENVTPLVSVRRAFDSFDLEAHLLYQNGLVTGLGGSGLVGDVVVYGEAWLLTDSSLTGFSGRGALGLNGNLERGTWTLEAAYLTPGEVSLKDDDVAPAQLSPTVKPRPAVLGQVALPLGDEGDRSLSLTGNAFFDPDAVRSGIGASYTLLADAELTLGAAARFGPEPAVATLSLGVKGFF